MAYEPDWPVRLQYPFVSADTRAGADGQRIYVTWTRYDGWDYDVRLAVSTDGGASFSSPVALTQQMDVPDPPACTSAVGRDGTLYLVWFESGWEGPPYKYVMRRSTDAGASFDPRISPYEDPRTVVATRGLVNSEFNFWLAVTAFSLKIDRASVAAGRQACRANWVHIAYAADEELDPYRANANVYVVTSRDGGVTWEPPVMVNAPDDPAPPGHFPNDFGFPSQFMPAIAVSDAGHVGVSFYNGIDDVVGDPDTPAIANQSYAEYFAYSVDGAVTFEPEFPIELDESGTQADPWLHRQTDNPDLGEYGKPVEMTDYVDMTAYGRTFHPSWMTLHNWVTREQDPDWEWYRHQNYRYVGDIYTTRVEVTDGVPPDFDADCDVDLDDFGVFAACYNGSNNPPAPTCPPGADADLDHDGDVDLDDFSIFAGCSTGTQSGCVGAGVPCSGDGAAAGGSAPEQGGSDFPWWLLEDPEIQQLFDALREYYEEHGIPFTW